MQNLTKSIRVLLFFVLSFALLYWAKPVLVPLTLALLLALLLTPISRWLERKKVNKGLSAFLSVAVLLCVIGVLVALLKWQLGGLLKDLDSVESRFHQLTNQVKSYLDSTFGLSPQKQQELLKKQSAGLGKAGGIAAGILSSLSGIVVNGILVLIYMFLIIYFRQHFKRFVYKLVNPEHEQKAEYIISKAGKVTQQYLSGLGLMIITLWVMYGIGFSIVGVENAIFFAILCGTLELIPFVGNLTGTGITVLMGLAQGGGISLVAGILITYGLVQFIQSYIIEPLVVGDKVDLNPFSTIFILVVGEEVWGVGGMVMAIPILGIIKTICDNIEPLKPYGYLLGNADSSQQSESAFKKFFKKLFSR